MGRAARWTYLVLAWLFVVGVAVQALLAGMGLFVDSRDWATHINVGYWLPLVPILGLVAGAMGRVGRRRVALTAGLAVLAIIQTMLPPLRDGAPFLAALHPLNALVLFGLGLWLALDARAVIAEVARPPAQPEEPAPG
jgi:hypothetical protein